MAYRESFYRFLMTQRNPDSHDEIAEFANNAQHDQQFLSRNRIMKSCLIIWN